MHSCPTPHTQVSKFNIMANEADTLKVIGDLDLQEMLYYTQVAKKYNLDRTTLMCYYKHKTISYYKACLIH
jgi:hypothetical protein